MPRRSNAWLCLTALAFALSGCGGASDPRVPSGYPSNYSRIIDRADAEGHLLIWSVVDRPRAEGLLTDFHRAHPGIAVTYVEMTAQELDDRFLAAATQHRRVPDVLWSSAMDLQIKLCNDGYAQTYSSPEAHNLPDWANWKNEAWGTTKEPIVFVYNRHLIDDAQMPTSHLALTEFLETRPAGIRDRVATYDIASSAVGYLYLSQDEDASPDIWRLVRAIGKNKPLLYPKADQVIQAVKAGRAAIGYNVVGSTLLPRDKANPDIGLILPNDYMLFMSRIALIAKEAANPNAARLFIDFLLSKEGQTRLVQQAMPSVRTDFPKSARLQPAGSQLRAIRVGPELLVDRDQLTRDYFLNKWKAAIQSPPP